MCLTGGQRAPAKDRLLSRESQQPSLPSSTLPSSRTLPSEKSKKDAHSHSSRKTIKEKTETEWQNDASMRAMESDENDSEVFNVRFLDNTHVKVPAALGRRHRDRLVGDLTAKKKPIFGFARPANDPKYIQVVAYSTTDSITERDETSRSGRSKKSSRMSHVASRDRVAYEVLTAMIEKGPKQFDFNEQQLCAVLERGAEVFAKESSLLRVPVPCTVYGDIHGQYSDLLRWLNLNGWPNQTRSVFLGDFVDRGTHGIEVITLITCLKIVFPESIFVLRGNHEEEGLNQAYSFCTEVNARFPPVDGRPPVYASFKKLFSYLPMAVLIGGKILGMHGGISPKLTRLEDIAAIHRPIHDFEVGSLACDLVWSDPDFGDAAVGFKPNMDREPLHGIGQLFGADTVFDACERLNIKLILRGHQAPLPGYAISARGRLMTLFSAPGYKGKTAANVNMGASLEISGRLELTVRQIKVTPEFRKKRVAETERMKKIGKQMNDIVDTVS